MNSNYEEMINKLKIKSDLTLEEKKLLEENNSLITHKIIIDPAESSRLNQFQSLDIDNHLGETPTVQYYYNKLKTIDELLERDKKRERDGFPRKIKIGRIIKPGKGGKNKIIIVPTTVEEKLYHDEVKFKSPNSQDTPSENDTDTSGGTGEYAEGEILGEIPVHQEGQDQGGAGQGNDESHDLSSNAYDIGKILTEKFKLPNLKDKGKKKSFTKYSYDLTDKNRGFGQFLDKKATLKKIIETNKTLGRLNDVKKIDSTKFLIDPRDKIYRILSKEKDYESQALVFFIRDYSGSMYGKPTEIITSQHLLIYSWLSYQYENLVETKFILHDSEAKEVPDFYTYYNLSIAGGTYIASAYKLVNDIVKRDNLAKDYNIYVFHGTDGDDMDNNGYETLSEIKTMLRYVNRIGITVVKSNYSGNSKSSVEKYIENSNYLKEFSDLMHLSVINEDADERIIIEGIKDLIAEK